MFPVFAFLWEALSQINPFSISYCVLQTEQVFAERDILTFAENPFVVGMWCCLETKVIAKVDFIQFTVMIIITGMMMLETQLCLDYMFYEY